jgi:metal-dependent HD superfamily phosphatase/phosphodiesterase
VVLAKLHSQRIAKLLLEKGIKPSVIESGYKGKSCGGFIVSDGKLIFADASKLVTK